MADSEQRIVALEKQSQALDKLTKGLKDAHNNQHDVVKTLLDRIQALEKLTSALKEAHNGEHEMSKSLLGRVAELEKQIKTQTR